MNISEKLDSLDEKIDQIGLFVAVSEERLEKIEEWQKEHNKDCLKTAMMAIENKNDIKNLKWIGGGITTVLTAVLTWLGAR